MRVSAAGPPTTRSRELRRVLFSSYLGTTIEFYDFLLYGTAAAVVFPTVFFSGLDEFTAVLFSFGTFAAGYLARPLVDEYWERGEFPLQVLPDRSSPGCWRT